MAEFQEVIKQYNRMCKSMGDCKKCEMFNIPDLSFVCVKKLKLYPKETENIIMDWAKEHPAETWKSKADRLLPNNHIVLHYDSVCPSFLFGDNSPKIGYKNCLKDSIGGTYSCEKCWNSEVEEND